MTDEKKPVKITFAPGCFDNLEFESQEELDALVNQIQDMFDSGEAQVQAISLEQLMESMSEEELQALLDEVSEEVGVEELSSGFAPQIGKRTLH